MAEERTVVVEQAPRSSGGTWMIAVVLMIALIAGIYFFSQTSASEAVKDNAITNAANNVGEAAKDVGNAAESATNTSK